MGDSKLSHSIEVIRKSEQNTTQWSGGTTTEIAIYPQSAAYCKRNFIWRLSSARIDLAESTFTALPGISRVLMVLDGEITLNHRNHHEAHLKSLEYDRFCGGWSTKSTGKATDFNIMMSQECTGELSTLSLGAKENSETAVPLAMNSALCTSAFYCVNGSACFILGEKTAYDLQAGDALLLHSAHDNERIHLTVYNPENKKVHVIRADMQY